MPITRKTPETLPCTLNMKGQATDMALTLTYHNRSHDEYERFAKNPSNATLPEGVSADDAVAHMNAQMVLFLVKSFDDGTDKDFPLNYDGLMDMERTWPGALYGIVKGYHQARGMRVEKN